MRYVDDMFAIFFCKTDSLLFFNQLTSLFALEFTIEEEYKDNSLPFLDVHV